MMIMRVNKLNAAGLLLLASAMLLIVKAAQADIEHLKNLRDLYETAKELESPYLQVSENRQAYADKRAKLVYAFARESKSSHCERHYEQLKKIIEEYRIKAYNYVADCKKPSNWLSGFMKMVGPIGGMKNLAKFDKYLTKVTERYESQGSSGILSDKDVDCDLAKLQVRNLNDMLFVLQVDIKYLIMEDPQVNSIAIYRQLSANKFIANSNFYETDQLSSKQRELLLEFYAKRANVDQATVGQALNHYYNPGNLIIGRLLDSCHKVAEYRNIWAELEPNRVDTCAQSKSDMANGEFTSQFNLNNYGEIFDFCSKFLDSL